MEMGPEEGGASEADDNGSRKGRTGPRGWAHGAACTPDAAVGIAIGLVTVATEKRAGGRCSSLSCSACEKERTLSGAPGAVPA